MGESEWSPSFLCTENDAILQALELERLRLVHEQEKLDLKIARRFEELERKSFEKESQISETFALKILEAEINEKKIKLEKETEVLQLENTCYVCLDFDGLLAELQVSKIFKFTHLLKTSLQKKCIKNSVAI